MRLHAAWLSLAPLALLAACDVPTALPKYDTEWNVPAKSTSISVNSLLPSGMTATTDNSAFQVSVSPATTTITRQLAQDCSTCVASNGTTIPKPAFQGGSFASFAVPSTVSSATLLHDTLTLTVTNGFNFDPIRPSATARGYLLIRIVSGATVVGRDSVDGAVTALPAGATITRKVPLSGIVSGANGLQIVTELSSPAGDPVTIDASRTLVVSGTVSQLYVSAAQVNVANQAVSATGSDLDLSGVGGTIAKHANSGELLLTVDNPFSLTGNLTVTISGGSETIAKPISLGAGVTTPTISFTSDELTALLGHHVSVSFDGTVTGSNVSVQPGQVVSVSSRFQIALNPGSN